MRGLQLTCMLGVVLALLGQQVHAQQTSEADTTDEGRALEGGASVKVAYQRGIRAFKRGRPERAELLLCHVFSKQPTYAPAAREEPVSYWLGRAHEAQRDTGQALTVWKKGLETQQGSAQTSLLMAHAYLQLASAAGLASRTETASKAYRSLIGGLGRGGAGAFPAKTGAAPCGAVGLDSPEVDAAGGERRWQIVERSS